jgi:purine-nucleoside/S-methyl-5'-thioadenosine phosphorylase / adenosine deaminase
VTNASTPTKQAAPLTVAVPEDPYVRAAFSRRPSADEPTGAGNVSLSVGNEPGRAGSALAARARLAEAVGLGPADVVYAEQVHGTGVAVVGRADRGRGAQELSSAVPRADALVATEPGVGVAVLAADCMPLLLVLPGRAVAAVHAGRRGVEAGVVPAAVAALVAEHTASVSDVVAITGPTIGGCCYEVPEDLADRIASRVPATRATTRWGTPALDVRAGVQAQLEEAGVARVTAVGECTFCGGGPWFSARSFGSTLPGGGPPGRHAGIVCRHDPATGGPPPSS